MCCCTMLYSISTFYNTFHNHFQKWEVYAYSTAEEYDLEKLVSGLKEQGLYHTSAMSEGSLIEMVQLN